MTEAKPKRRAPALASRILIFGISFALTLVLITTFRIAALRLSSANAAVPSAAPSVAAAAPPPPPQQIIVKVIQVPAGQSSGSVQSAQRTQRVQPTIVHRYHYVSGSSSSSAHTVSRGS